MSTARNAAIAVEHFLTSKTAAAPWALAPALPALVHWPTRSSSTFQTAFMAPRSAMKVTRTP